MTRTDDADLVAAAQRGPEGFARLYERHYSAVFAFAYSRTSDYARAEDITAQTFLQAFQAIRRYEYRGVPIVHWLLRIAANVAAETHRRRILVSDAPAASRHGETRVADPDNAMERWELTHDLASLLEALTPDQREVVVLRFAHDLKVTQIAATTGRSEGSVKMLLLRALTALRRQVTRQPAAVVAA